VIHHRLLLGCAVCFLVGVGQSDAQVFTTTIDCNLPYATNAFGINDSGIAVGVYLDASSVAHAFVFNGTSCSKIDPPTAAYDSAATGISNSNEIVGYFATSDGHSHGFTLNGSTYAMIDYPGATHTWVYGINSNGELVGRYYGSDGYLGYHAFLRDAGGFHNLDPAGASYADANGLNDAGDIVGHYQTGNQIQAFLLHAGTLQIITPPGVANIAFGINNLGQVVGIYHDSVGEKSFLVSQGVMSAPVLFPNAVVTELRGINDNEQMVGTYSDSTGAHGFILVITSSTGPISLSFPVPTDPVCGGVCSPKNTPIAAVFDHEMLDAYEQNCDLKKPGPLHWGTIEDFRGERANINRQPPTGPGYGRCGTLYGYADANGSTFLSDVTYKGKTILWYDSHPGYDYAFVFGTKVYAAVSGCVSYVTPPAHVANSSDFHVVTIIPSNTGPAGGCTGANSPTGYFIYYMHLSSFLDKGLVVRSESEDGSQIVGCPECAQPDTWIEVGTLVGYTGNFAVTKRIRHGWGGVLNHLHFEVDLKKGGVLKPVDPYGWHPLDFMHADPYLQINPGFVNLTLWNSFIP
jgi:hypothetical protein